ncbi:GH16595 [Drosophila grimshawi]|uniref:GH16595 n=2 Tax=Drosophila grimshawi TaxID=7222 RepID=B4J263_DROGR|nr:GH16595 [Drosophila grimshawi]
MLNLLVIIIWMDYCHVYYGYDLLFWLEEIGRKPVEYLLSATVLLMFLHVVTSCVTVTILSTLIGRNTNRINKPRAYLEERYRRFVVMRLVQQLENALQMQKRYAAQTEHGQPKELTMLENLYTSHKQILQAVDDFRRSVAVLLWPNRADIQMDAYILYHIDEIQLEELKSQGYRLNVPHNTDIRNEHIKRLLNPPGY